MRERNYTMLWPNGGVSGMGHVGLRELPFPPSHGYCARWRPLVVYDLTFVCTYCPLRFSQESSVGLNKEGAGRPFARPERDQQS